jgi:hypothetical protein
MMRALLDTGVLYQFAEHFQHCHPEPKAKDLGLVTCEMLRLRSA